MSETKPRKVSRWETFGLTEESARQWREKTMSDDTIALQRLLEGIQRTPTVNESRTAIAATSATYSVRPTLKYTSITGCQYCGRTSGYEPTCLGCGAAR
jgi:hypothetical protein